MADGLTRRGAVTGLVAAVAAPSANAAPQQEPAGATGGSAPGQSAALVGLKQDSPLAITRTIRDQLLDTWSVEQFIPELQMADYRAMKSSYDMGAQLMGAIGTIQDIRPYGVLTSGGGRLKCNRTLKIDANKLQLALRCMIDMTGNDDEVGVLLGSSAAGGAFADRRCRIDGLNLIGKSAVAKQQVALALRPKEVGGGQLNQFSITNLSLSQWRTMVELGEDVYCGEIEDFLFNVGVIGLHAPGSYKGKPLGNAGERITIAKGTMAGVETGIFNDNDHCNIFARSISFDYPVKFTTGPCFLHARRGSIDALHIHCEGNNKYSSMTGARPFVMGNASSARLTVRDSKFLCAEQLSGEHVFTNAHDHRAMKIDGLEIFQAFGKDGYLASGRVELGLDPGTLNQTFLGYLGSRQCNLNPDDFEGTRPLLACVDPQTGPDQPAPARVSISKSAKHSGSSSLKIEKLGGAGSGECYVSMHFPMPEGALPGIEFWLSKQGALNGPVFWSMDWVHGFYEGAGRFMTVREDKIAISKLADFSAAPADWKAYQLGGFNYRAPSWTTHLRLRLSLSAINGNQGALYLDDLVVTRLR